MPSTSDPRRDGPVHPAKGVIARVHTSLGEAAQTAYHAGMFVSNVDGVRLSVVGPAGFSPCAPIAPTGDSESPATSFRAAA